MISLAKVGLIFMATPKSTVPADALIIVPSETIFSEEEWKKIRAGTAKNPSAEERSAAKKTWEKKLPSPRLRKTGPKGGDPTSLAQQQRQHYLWMFRQLLEVNSAETSEVEVIERICLCVFNFGIHIQQGLFFTKLQVGRMQSLVSALKLDPPDECVRSLAGLLVQPFDAPDPAKWAQIQKGSIVSSPKTTSALIHSCLVPLLGLHGAAYSLFHDPLKRQRKSNAGRKVKSVPEITILSEAVPGQFSFTLPTEESKQQTRQVTEHEILRRTLSEMLCAKNFILGRHYFEVSEQLAEAVHMSPEGCDGSRTLIEAFELLREVGAEHPNCPWAQFTPLHERLFGFDSQPFGMFGVR